MGKQQKIREYQIKVDASKKQIKKLEQNIQDTEDFQKQFFLMREQMEESLFNRDKQLSSGIISNRKVKSFQRYETSFLHILHGTERTKMRLNMEQSIEDMQKKIQDLLYRIDELRHDIRRYERYIEDLRNSLSIV